MPISRMQQPRQMYGLGSLDKKAVKGVTGAVKKIAGSDLGKAALLAAGGYYLGGGNMGPLAKFLPVMQGSAASSPIFGNTGFRFGNILPNLGGIMGLKGGKENLLANTLKVGGYGTLLGGALAGMEGEEEASSIGGERNVEALRTRLTKAYRELRYPEEQIPALVEADLAEYTSGAGGYAEGGRIQYGLGSLVRGSRAVSASMNAGDTPVMSGSGMGGMIAKLISNNPNILRKLKNNNSISYSDFIDENFNGIDDRQEAAMGGRIGFAMGPDNPETNAMQAANIEGLPLNQNPVGVTELDLRETGGFIPPVGVKEKADDIPAMLSNNEFVMTADAVREFGDGDVNKGAERMYAMMKKLENGGRV